MTTTFDTKVEELRRSSMFRSGDKDSFQVSVGDSVLPGKFDPAAYLDMLGLKHAGGRVAVVCPGNCGIMVELHRRGAERVVGFEPRKAFHRSMTSVLQLLNQHENAAIWPFSSNLWWPSSAVLKNSYDLIVWANGLELSNTPAVNIEGALSILAPGGSLFVEVNHGNHGVPERRVNAWRPSKDAFFEVVLSARPDATIKRICDGRLANRVVYQISEEIVILEEDLGKNLFVGMVDEANFMARPRPADAAKVEKLVDEVSASVKARFADEVVDELELKKAALASFPEEIQSRIQSLLDAGIDYHVVSEAFERDGADGIVALESPPPLA